MKNFDNLTELLNFMCLDSRYVFVNDFSGWGIESDIRGFGRKSTPEGHILKAANGAEYGHQDVYYRRGNHLTVSLREKGEEVKKLPLNSLEMFKDFQVVVETSGEMLKAFAPVFSRKKDLIIYLAELEDYFDGLKKSSAKYKGNVFDEIANLAIYLYKNNPEKKEEQYSILNAI